MRKKTVGDFEFLRSVFVDVVRKNVARVPSTTELFFCGEVMNPTADCNDRYGLPLIGFERFKIKFLYYVENTPILEAWNIEEASIFFEVKKDGSLLKISTNQKGR